MEDDLYLSVSKRGESLYKEKGSKFIGIAIPVSSEEDFKKEQDNLKQIYHDARHLCYAFKIGIENEIIAKGDDGEPMHSAGDPILGQIIANNLVNVAVFVVRYFGGTKLGVGGLKQAYKTAASEAIDDSRIKKYIISDHLNIHFTYTNSAQVMKLIDDFNALVTDQKYDEKCFLNVKVRKSKSEEFLKKLQQLEYLGIRAELEK